MRHLLCPRERNAMVFHARRSKGKSRRPPALSYAWGPVSMVVPFTSRQAMLTLRTCKHTLPGNIPVS